MARRTLLVILVTIGLGTAAGATGSTSGTPRVAVLNWGLAQTMVALDVAPVAVANTIGYRKWVTAPALPDGVVDLGRRIEPDLDVLASTRPDLILISGYYNRAGDQLARIAPTETLRIYQPGGEALQRSLEVAAELAARFERQDRLARLRDALDAAVERLRARARADESVYVIQFRDGAHVRVYGRHGLFDGVLRRAGLDNAWDGATNFWGFASVPVDRLDAPADHLVVIDPVPRDAEALMAGSPVWQALPAVRSGRVHRLAPVWSYGGVPAATRFAYLLAAAIDGDG